MTQKPDTRPFDWDSTTRKFLTDAQEVQFNAELRRSRPDYTLLRRIIDTARARYLDELTRSTPKAINVEATLQDLDEIALLSKEALRRSSPGR